MTTAEHMARPRGGVLGPLAATAGLGLLMGGLAAALTGTAGALGALVGTALVCAVFASGAVVLGVVAWVAPRASLLVALLTYTLQVLAVGLFYVALSGAGAFDGPVDERWLGAAVIGGTLVWTAAAVGAFLRLRQPAFDLPDRGPKTGQEASVR